MIIIFIHKYLSFLYIFLFAINKLLFSMKRILTSSGKQADKRTIKERTGLKVEQKDRPLDLRGRDEVDLTFQLSLAAILKENRLSNTKLKTQRKSRRGLLDQNLKGKYKSRKVLVQTTKSIKALSSQRFHRYCLTTLQTQCLSIKTDQNISLTTKRFYLDKSDKHNMNEISEMKDQILYNLEQNNQSRLSQIKEKVTVCRLETELLENIVRQQPIKMIEQITQKQQINVLEQINKIRCKIKQKIDSITDILGRITLLASQKKVNFSHILFLIYKLFYHKRVKITQLLCKLSKQNSIDNQMQQYEIENNNIHKCMIEMLEKLRQSKKWRDVQMKWLYEKQNLGEGELRLMHQNILDRFISDYSKLAAVTEEEKNQNSEIMHQFFIGFLDLYQIQYDQNIKSNIKQQYKKLKKIQSKPSISSLLTFLKDLQKTL